MIEPLPDVASLGDNSSRRDDRFFVPRASCIEAHMDRAEIAKMDEQGFMIAYEAVDDESKSGLLDVSGGSNIQESCEESCRQI